MAKGQTLKRLANLRKLVAEALHLGEVDVYNVIEIFNCSDSGARKYLAELVCKGVLIHTHNAPTSKGMYGARIFQPTKDEALIQEFIGSLEPEAPARDDKTARTLTGYPAERAKSGVFLQFQHQAKPVRKVVRDPLVAALFGPAEASA